MGGHRRPFTCDTAVSLLAVAATAGCAYQYYRTAHVQSGFMLSCTACCSLLAAALGQPTMPRTAVNDSLQLVAAVVAGRVVVVS